MDSRAPLPWLKPGLFIGALAPLALVAVEAFTGTLGANPVAETENGLGLTALIFLVASLVCTPARKLFGWTWAARIRRELGLFTFFYAVLHVLVYLFLDQGLDVGAIVEDIVKRPFITAGFAAFVLLIPLALTSTSASVRRLGYRRWTLLHQLVYVAGVLAVVHFFWRVKLDVSQPLVYACMVGVLLVFRVGVLIRKRREPRAVPAARSVRNLPRTGQAATGGAGRATVLGDDADPSEHRQSRRP